MKTLQNYEQFLQEQEKSENTITKYLSEAAKFLRWLDGGEISKNSLLAYKQYLAEKHLPAGANAAISTLNNLLEFLDLSELKIKTLKVQRQVFSQSEKELTRMEYDNADHLRHRDSYFRVKIYHGGSGGERSGRNSAER